MVEVPLELRGVLARMAQVFLDALGCLSHGSPFPQTAEQRAWGCATRRPRWRVATSPYIGRTTSRGKLARRWETSLKPSPVVLAVKVTKALPSRSAVAVTTA